jgi:hypothetical protein
MLFTKFLKWIPLFHKAAVVQVFGYSQNCTNNTGRALGRYAYVSIYMFILCIVVHTRVLLYVGVSLVAGLSFCCIWWRPWMVVGLWNSLFLQCSLNTYAWWHFVWPFVSLTQPTSTIIVCDLHVWQVVWFSFVQLHVSCACVVEIKCGRVSAECASATSR